MNKKIYTIRTVIYTLCTFIAMHFIVILSMMPWAFITNLGEKTINGTYELYLAGISFFLAIILITFSIIGVTLFVGKKYRTIAIWQMLMLYGLLSMLELIFSDFISKFFDKLFLLPSTFAYLTMWDTIYPEMLIKSQYDLSGFEILLLVHPIVIFLIISIITKYFFRK